MNNKCQHFLINENCQVCQEIQNQWYKKLKGFEDIEDKRTGLLKKWTGLSIPGNMVLMQECLGEIQTSWPETNFKKEEEFLNHPDFLVICKSIFKHKNNRVNYETIIHIWTDHCEGLSSREIGRKHKIFYVTIHRAIRRIEELIKIMDLTDSNKTVVLRDYESFTDDPFIFSTWRKAVWFDKQKPTDSLDPIFFRQKTKQIRNILASPNILIRLACLKDDPDQIIGYSILDNMVIEFVYVKVDYRKQGIASLLTKGFKSCAQPTTKIGASIIKRHDLSIQGEKEDGITEESQSREA